MSENAYKVDGPACISFSGGRTSGFMLRKVLDAHGGALPDDVVICFANTGLEHPATYQFVERCEQEWGVGIYWLEYDATRDEGGWKHTARCVTPTTASRNGEPFTKLLTTRGFLPNPVARFCTQDLKIRTIKRFLDANYGWDSWTNVIGLRADEPHRVARIKDSRERYDVAAPMARAGHGLRDVLAFWRDQPFDLELPGGDNTFGNCVGCFLKGRHKIERIAREQPEHLAWWADAEGRFISSATGNSASFRSDRPGYRIILKQVKDQPVMFPTDCGDGLDTCMCHD